MASADGLGVAARFGAWVLGAGLALLAAGEARAGVTAETRDFTVSVDGNPAGDVHMTITKQEDGSTTMSCDTDITVKVLLIEYKYSYRGQEQWKDGRLKHFSSTCNDNGKRCKVDAVADGADLRVWVNNAERAKAPGNVWLTSYWAQPDSKVLNTTVPIMDADTGRDLEGKVQFIATEQRGVLGQTVNLNHYRLSGKVNADLWYDGAGRLGARQEWLEEGHKTCLELTRLRR